ncbi:MAG: hypothetical protein KBC81_02535 [Candidatus Pacebacteria bacterium]|nr:hypothetical protein [Candidatus Paceibacterota bacterium]
MYTAIWGYLVVAASAFSTLVLLVMAFVSWFLSDVWTNPEPEQKTALRILHFFSFVLLCVKWLVHSWTYFSQGSWIGTIWYFSLSAFVAFYIFVYFPWYMRQVYVIRPRRDKMEIARRNLENYQKNSLVD